MENDLISRSALLSELQSYKEDLSLVFESLEQGVEKRICSAEICGVLDAIIQVKNAPAVDAVVLPEGKPGDYLEWNNGVGHRQIYAILSVMICKDCIRYELADFAPVVNHEGIVRILSPEEVEKMVKERGKAWKYMWCEDDNKTASGTEG